LADSLRRDSVDTQHMKKIFQKQFMTMYHSFSSASWPTTSLVAWKSIVKYQTICI